MLALRARIGARSGLRAGAVRGARKCRAAHSVPPNQLAALIYGAHRRASAALAQVRLGVSDWRHSNCQDCLQTEWHSETKAAIYLPGRSASSGARPARNKSIFTLPGSLAPEVGWRKAALYLPALITTSRLTMLPSGLEAWHL